MAVNAAGQVLGSVSGGCVEGAVYEVCEQVLASGQPQIVHYGVSHESAFAAGLSCGGDIELFVQAADQPLISVISDLASAIAEHRPLALVTAVSAAQPTRRMLVGPAGTVTGTLGSADLDTIAIGSARTAVDDGRTGPVDVVTSDSARHELFIQPFSEPALMLVFGAVAIGEAVARIGHFLGYRVIVCDARPVFATPARFPAADEVVAIWPHKFFDTVRVDQRTVVCDLTHDDKFDIPLLVKALRSSAGYVGALGSRRTHQHRLGLLREAGLTDEELARLHSPIGLDLGGRSPEETAISIAAEIVASRHLATGASLSTTDAPIHGETSTVTVRPTQLS